MQQAQQHQRPPPPAYAQHEPESFHLPSVPTHLPNAEPNNARLPGIKSLDLPDTKARHTPRNSIELSPKSHLDGSQWGALPGLHSATFPKVPEGLPREDIGSPMDTASVRSTQEDSVGRRDTSVSMDDPDVRLAAEALSGLGNPGTYPKTRLTITNTSWLTCDRLRTLTDSTVAHSLRPRVHS